MLLGGLLALGMGAAQAADAANNANPSTANAKTPHVKFTTSVGSFTVELNRDAAPITVDNFLQYVRDKHYNGTIFHRVISNFMVQGGGYDSRLFEKSTRAPIVHEGREALARGGPRNTVGTIAMARTNVPNSATSQFFINVVDNAFLDPTPQNPGYTVFGRVIEGMDTIEKIRTTPTGPAGPFRTDVPRTPIIIESAVILSN
jgi:peptidyl-prolyl cis-trans isomerase A (cyclophilin A)